MAEPTIIVPESTGDFLKAIFFFFNCKKKNVKFNFRAVAENIN